MCAIIIPRPQWCCMCDEAKKMICLERGAEKNMCARSFRVEGVYTPVSITIFFTFMLNPAERCTLLQKCSVWNFVSLNFKFCSNNLLSTMKIKISNDPFSIIFATQCTLESQHSCFIERKIDADYGNDCFCFWDRFVVSSSSSLIYFELWFETWHDWLGDQSSLSVAQQILGSGFWFVDWCSLKFNWFSIEKIISKESIMFMRRLSLIISSNTTPNISVSINFPSNWPYHKITLFVPAISINGCGISPLAPFEII